jgi:hypothetical protein
MQRKKFIKVQFFSQKRESRGNQIVGEENEAGTSEVLIQICRTSTEQQTCY